MLNFITKCLSLETFRSIFSFFAGEAKYIWGLKRDLDVLQTEFDKLIETRDDLLNQVGVAEQQPDQIRRSNHAEGWLERVKKMETKVAELQQVRDQEIDRLCLFGFCSKNLISTNQFGRRVERLKDDVMSLFKERGDMQEVMMVPKAAAVATSIDQRTIFGPQSLFDRVWRCIQDEDELVGVIGLYGTGGVGKTTLLKRVNNNFLSVQHHSDVVIWSLVSREPNLEKIQDDIGKRIGLSADSWKTKSLEDKALDISDILSQKNFVLLLDDIWEFVDLAALGVPLQSSKTASKIVFTTRSFIVCCQMQATEKLYVSSLEHEEAWKLFQEVVGRDVLDSHSAIPQQAENLAKECGGLPLALITLGRTMSYKTTLEEWENAIEDLRALKSEFLDMEKEVFSCLKYSYDNLSDYRIKSCFLYCSLFPEDYRIPKEELADYWVSEGLADDLLEGLKNISHLLHQCLLEKDDDAHVKMHDVVRDMALWTAQKADKEEENFLVHAGDRFTDAPKIEEWKEVKRISLMANKIQNFMEIPTCPRLQTLLLNDNEILTMIDGFFQFMPSLRVLNLRRNDFLKELPPSISNLVLLQHLDVSETFILELPQELKALMNLRYLNLEDTARLRIPRQLLSSFSKLEVLMMRNCRALDPLEEEGNILSESAEALIKELFCLEQLNLISLTLISSRAVELFFKSPKLKSITRSLSIRHCEGVPLINILHLASMEHLKELNIYGSNLEELKIYSKGEVEKVIQRGFRRLHTVYIIRCYNVKDLTWLAFAPNLKKILIRSCDDVEELVSFEKLSEVSEIMEELNLFAQLEDLYVWELVNLKSIYGNPLPFPQLKTIDVYECPNLKKLPLNSSSAKERQIVILGNKEWWDDLQWEDEATRNVFSTSFLR